MSGGFQLVFAFFCSASGSFSLPLALLTNSGTRPSTVLGRGPHSGREAARPPLDLSMSSSFIALLCQLDVPGFSDFPARPDMSIHVSASAARLVTLALLVWLLLPDFTQILTNLCIVSFLYSISYSSNNHFGCAFLTEPWLLLTGNASHYELPPFLKHLSHFQDLGCERQMGNLRG